MLYSNSLAPSSNQSWFKGDNTVKKGRVFYKIYAGGKYNYSFMFTNKIDSTYADGKHSWCNVICDEWEIISLYAYVTDTVNNDLENEERIKITFEGNESKKVIAGEIFYSDTIEIDCNKDQYICLEIEFKGENKIPYMEEMMIESFVLDNGSWVRGKQIPISASVMCDRSIDKKVAFFGDSITEGIGVEFNSYNWWCSKIADYIGEKNGYWDIGIGFGRAQDAASKGSWLSKAKMADVVTVCFGVNDICQGFSEEIVINSLITIVNELKSSNIRVILFTVPPFDYNEEKKAIWKNVNSYIKEELSKVVEVFDVVPIWGDKEPNEQKAIYGGHPNSEGSALLAKDFVSKIQL